MYKDKITVLDARDERSQAERTLEEMGLYIGQSRHRDDKVALGHLKTASVVLGRQPDPLLLAVPAIREIIRENRIQVKPGYAYLQVAVDEESRESKWLSVDGTPVYAVSNHAAGPWQSVLAGSHRLEVGGLQNTVSLVAGHFYRVTTYPLLSYERELEGASGLAGFLNPPARPTLKDALQDASALKDYQKPPSEPEYLDEYRRTTRVLRSSIHSGEWLFYYVGAPTCTTFITAITVMMISINTSYSGGTLPVGSAGVSGQQDNNKINLAAPLMILGSAAAGIGLGWLIDLILGEEQPLRPPQLIEQNVETNKSRRASWEAEKARIDEQNAKILEEENRRREDSNRMLIRQWQEEAGRVERANRGILADANEKIRLRNLAVQEKNKERGRFEVKDISGYEPISLP